LDVSIRLIARVADRYAKKINLDEWGLQPLTEGKPVTLYHGTTRMFKTFDLGKSRDELVNKFYGNGIFLVPSKRTAEKYALANRNVGFDPSLVDDLKAKNPGAGKFMERLVEDGDDAWEKYYNREAMGLTDDNQSLMEALEKEAGGVDPNTIADVAGYVIGSKVRRMPDDDGTLNIFNQSTGLPEFMYKNLDEIGLDSEVYRPKVYKVSVQADNVLVTANSGAARGARGKGYYCVIFYGSDLVDGVPEVAVFSPKNARVMGYEVV
jgi:hypothetical protein